ncbi:PQ-loop-domain-containing protein [Metschnikowia bicuspidata]|uniref:PQ-loop-domain-containing protein n=1 Tax=Metschnikowia bicuspidata TaxID=27322 RepID=A0A4V1J2N4_9ASCO|nr:PQ-loop-domain-containing protein [Metschnikowia bicuspidata]
MTGSVADNVLGTIGTILFCIQLVPQIIRNYRVKECTGIPPLMMFLWSASGIPFSIYFFGINASVALKVQPILFTFFCIVGWTQTLFYPPVQMPIKKIKVLVGLFVLLAVDAQVGFILWLHPLYARGVHWPMLMIAIIASVLLILGLIPPYFKLAKRKGRVVGINFIFLSMDASGALFSLLSVVMGNMDTMSLIMYLIILAMEIGIFASAIFWYLTGGRSILKQEKLEAARVKEDLLAGSSIEEAILSDKVIRSLADESPLSADVAQKT